MIPGALRHCFKNTVKAYARSCLALPFKQVALAFHAPAIAGNAAIVAHHTVAGNGNGDLVCRAGLRHSANGPWRTDPFGDVSITYCFPSRNFA